MCGFVIRGGCGLDWWWKRKVVGFWLWRLGWCVMGCWVLVVAARMVGCRLLGFGCGSYDDGLWWQGFGCGSYDDGLWWLGWLGFGCGDWDGVLWVVGF